MDWSKGARMINEYRMVPRTIITVYFTFFIHAWYYIVDWFMKFDWSTLPNDQIVGAASAAAIAGFPAIILGVLTTVLKALIESYWNGSSSPTAAGQGEG